MPTPAKVPDLEEYFFPWAGVAMNTYIIRNLSKNLTGNCESYHQSNNQPGKMFNPLALVVSGNRIAPDHILAEQGRVCSIVNMSCCTWGRKKTSDETEMELDKNLGTNQMIKYSASWFFGIFSWLPSGTASWFRFSLQIGLNGLLSQKFFLLQNFVLHSLMLQSHLSDIQ